MCSGVEEASRILQRITLGEILRDEGGVDGITGADDQHGAGDSGRVCRGLGHGVDLLTWERHRSLGHLRPCAVARVSVPGYSAME